KPKNEMAPLEKVLITICSADRKTKKTFMSLPSRKDVIEKAHKYGLTGNTIVLESNGCEICEDEVLLFAAKEKILLMLLAENDEYIILPPPSPLNRSDRAGSGFDASFVNDSTVSNDETLSLASVTPSHGKNTSAHFKDFVIPWSKVPNEIMKHLRGKTSLGKRLNTLANLLVDSLRERHAHIPIRVFREVAQLAAEKYPESLLEKDREGQQIATTPQSLISKMINRNNALNRPQKRSSSTSLDTHANNSAKKRKSIQGAVASNGSAKSAAVNRDLEEKKQQLIASYRGNADLEAATIAEHMKECFPLQRAFFNNSEKIPDINAIKDNWPYIFRKQHLYQHFELLMSIDPRLLEKHFSSERERIFKFFKSSKNKKISALEENNANVVRGLAYHFNEDPDYIFKQLENGPLPKDVLQHMNPTNAPWVALVNTPDADASAAKTEALVYIEGKIMSTFTATDVDLPDILAQLLCYYYTFNMMYPKEANQTLEFIVIYFLQNTPEQARNSKKSVSSNSKYNQLIAKLANANG
ncbi:CG17078, partial [Drosophila busckii]